MTEQSPSPTAGAERGAQIGAAVGERLGGAAQSLAAKASDTGAVLSGFLDRAVDSEPGQRAGRAVAAARDIHLDREIVQEARRRAADSGASLIGLVEQARPVVRHAVDAVPEVLEGILEQAGHQVDVVLGRRVQRRWPWAVGAAAAGAVAGGAVAVLVRRLVGHDAPDAQAPEELRAVVDQVHPDQQDPSKAPLQAPPLAGQ